MASTRECYEECAMPTVTVVIQEKMRSFVFMRELGQNGALDILAPVARHDLNHHQQNCLGEM
jgi:hypothetical protein